MRQKEIILFAGLILAANISLFFGVFPAGLVYLPEKVAQGQWWRLVTHPFVHVSFYHLLLDGAAFLMLYAQLDQKSMTKRIAYLFGIHVAVVMAVTVSLPSVRAIGYCGLSGIAHGLMGLWCLERMGIFDKPSTHSGNMTERLVAVGIFIGLLVKAGYEAATGHAFFESMHLGDVGVPVAASHLGGVLGAIAGYGIVNASQFISYQKKRKALILQGNLK